jgi:hypothetical protein
MEYGESIVKIHAGSRHDCPPFESIQDNADWTTFTPTPVSLSTKIPDAELRRPVFDESPGLTACSRGTLRPRDVCQCNGWVLKFTTKYAVLCRSIPSRILKPSNTGEVVVFARKVAARLKPNSLVEFSRLMECEILPWLKKQEGFLDLIVLAAPGGIEVATISF